MAISQKRYIEITSAVGGNDATSLREYIVRVMTKNALAPMGSVLEFTSIDNVMSFFGSNSEEYKFAEKYFGFISKDVVKPKKISFARWTDTNIYPVLTSTQASNTLSDFTLPWDDDPSGTMNLGLYLTMDGVTKVIAPNMASGDVNSLTDVASKLQTTIRAAHTTDAWRNATVTFANNQFVLQSGDTTSNDIVVAQIGNPSNPGLSVVLGWNSSTNPVFSQGSAAETPVEAISRIASVSNNFGSFVFIGDSLTSTQIADVAAWNKAQNIKFVYSVPVTSDNAAQISTATDGLDGTCLTLTTDGGYEEYMPCAVLAATDYSRPNAAKNYMFQQFSGAVASVDADADADVYDNMRVNYYGQTQQAGRGLSFYQRGVLQGDVEDIGVYCNEIWLKDSITVALFNLLMGVEKVPANLSGVAMARGVMQETIDTALLNGTIIPQKTLTATQKAYIKQITNDDDAWFAVYDNGYWLDVKITSTEENGTTTYKIEYILVYSKGDSIKKVEGSHILI